MTYSIFHFFKHLIQNKSYLNTVQKLDDFPFDEGMIAYQHKSIFPDIALRVNVDRSRFSGGELIELKDAKSYSVASFNSQIPTGQKRLSALSKSAVKRMRESDPETDNQNFREVFYLVRGQSRRKNMETAYKICLVTGSFFETVSPQALIRGAFEQVIYEKQAGGMLEIPEDIKQQFLDALTEQASFSKSRSVENASVSIRFRIMTEARDAGNILSSTQYPDIKDNTLNFVLHCDTDDERRLVQQKMQHVMGDDYDTLTQFDMKHPYNGNFLVFQIEL